MKALISPDEQRIDANGNIGARIAQVEPDDKIFPVSTSLFWIDCPDNCVPDVWWYYNGKCEVMAPPITAASDEY